MEGKPRRKDECSRKAPHEDAGDVIHQRLQTLNEPKAKPPPSSIGTAPSRPDPIRKKGRRQDGKTHTAKRCHIGHQSSIKVMSSSGSS